MADVIQRENSLSMQMMEFIGLLLLRFQSGQ